MVRSLKEDWEFNLLEINNYRTFCFKHNYYDFIAENHHYLDGDIMEVGVYRGSSILATALLLKELGSDKVVYGYDSFEGFPADQDPNDSPSRFKEMAESGQISAEHYHKIQVSHEYLKLRSDAAPCAQSVSTSSNFSNTSLEMLERKIDYLGLDNVRLVKGFFKDTLNNPEMLPESIMAGLIDCDLYQSYMIALPVVWERLCMGGYLYLDEYFSLKFPGGRLASDAFFEDKGDKPQQHRNRAGDFERWFVRKFKEC